MPPDGGEGEAAAQRQPARPSRMDRHRRRSLAETVRLSPVQVFGAAFLFLIGAAAAVTLGQFTASSRAPWVALGFSAGAVLCTAISLFMRRRR